MKNDLIVRFQDNGEFDPTRSNVISADTTFDNMKLNRQKLKELIETNDPILTYVELSLKYALRFYDSVRNSGASDVVTMKCCDSFDDLWIEQTKEKTDE